jgi:hypothetical protein
MDAQLTKTRQENFCTWRPYLEREEARSRLIGNSLTIFHQFENARTVQENSEGSGGSSAPVRGEISASARSRVSSVRKEIAPPASEIIANNKNTRYRQL